MEPISQLARSICESPTLKLNETAALLRDKGEPVIHLGGGEPKSRAPIDAIVNCTALLNTGEVATLRRRHPRPEEGDHPLHRGALRQASSAPENVMASSGAKQAIMVALHAILDPKDEVIFPAPYWVSYPGDGQAGRRRAGAGDAPKTAASSRPSRRSPRRSARYTKAIILNSPNNPSGVVYSRDFIAGVVELCEKRDIWLIMDDTYNRLVFDGRDADQLLRVRRRTDIENSQDDRHQLRLEDVRDDRVSASAGRSATKS